MNSALPLLPILLPILFGVLLLLPLARGWRVGLSLLSAALMLLSSLALLRATSGGEILTSALGGWAAPYGIVMVADRLASILSVLASVAALISLLHAAARPDAAREKYGLFAFLQLLFAGVQLSFLTGDLFNLFVAFEVMLVASYALSVLGSTRQQLREGFRYIVMNLTASALLVVTAGLIYGVLGTLNFADLSRRSAELGPNTTVTSLGVLLLIVFAAKSALFPLGFWLPGTYPAVPGAVGAFFAAILTKVGVYALLRITLTVFNQEAQVAQTILLLFGGVTMLTGALGALTQREWRRILSFTVMSSVGYLAYGAGLGQLGLGQLTAEGASLSATLFYLLGSVLVTLALFLVAAGAEQLSGQSDVRRHGFLDRSPGLAAAFMLCALTLAGLPPTAGFIAKFGLIQAGVQGGPLALIATGCALLASLILLYAMLDIWRNFFWGPRSEGRVWPIPRRQALPLWLSVGLVALSAIFAGPLYALCVAAAGQLSEPGVYIRSVLP
ncbi:proton-conducting transporter membrane subunit [Deinococcus sp.]|uniref:proton-conducting transporter transmembrane domain-containing protein n=1 Tax=Deinococcus sp. TaxID=47478 RepID=UPI003B5B04BE